jgi:CHAT domain-containing protein
MVQSSGATTEGLAADDGDARHEMWRRVRGRLAGEDVRVSFADALDVVRAVGGPGSPEGVDASWAGWTGHRLKALYLVAVWATGGIDGREPRPAALSQPRLLELRLALSRRLSEVATPDDTLSAHDVAAIQGLAGIDDDCAEAARLVAARQSDDAILARLRGAADEYRATLDGRPLSPAGRRVVAWKAANALDWLAGGLALRRDDDKAWTRFAQACAGYEEAADPVHAQRCRDRMMECDQRRAPDADALLKSLSAQLDATTPATLTRSRLLVALAELCIDQNDVYGAKLWAQQALVDLADQHFPAPSDEQVESMVMAWCQAAPAGEPGQNRFFATFGALTRMQATLATVLQVTEPAYAARHEAVIEALADVVAGLPAQMEVVGAALDARLDGYLVPGWTPGSAESTRANARAAADAATYREIMRGINQLQDTLGSIMRGTAEGGPAAALAERVVKRARTFGQPVVTAQALSGQGQVLRAAGRLNEAIAPLQEAYRLVSVLDGAAERDVAILALSILASVYAGLGDWETLSEVAGEAIATGERDRYRINAPYLQASYLSGYLEVFVAGIFSAFKLGDVDTMLRRMELSKGHASLRSLVPSASPETAGTDVLTDLIRTASNDIDSARRAGSGDLDGLIEKRQRLWDLRSVEHRDELGDIPQFSVAALRSALAVDEGIIDYYWLSDTVLLVVTLTATAVEVERRILSPDQRALIDGFIAEITSMKGANLSLDRAFIAPLAATLLPESGLALLAGVRRLAISPHRKLHWFPFHALPLGDTTVARRFAVRYIPNLTSLLLPRRPPPDARFAGIAITHFPGVAGLDDLAGVDEEIDSIASAYRDRGFDSRVLKEATRAALAAWSDDGTLDGAACLQLSTHGSPLSETAPMEASIYLADGRVDGLEIGLWDLRCEVVVLGSCDSGQLAVTDREGGDLAGDEMFGLPAALLAAGARSVLASSWPVDNETAMAFMPAWHRFFADGHPADVALQLAQETFLQTASFKQKRAYYWAPFFLLSLGRPEAIPAADRRPLENGTTHG